MAKLTWLGEDAAGVAGPSFTTAFGGIHFPKGEPVEVDDPDMVNRAKKNRFFSVKDDPPPVPPDHSEDGGDDDGLDDMKIADLRNVAEASGIDHHGLSKSELRDAIRAADKQASGNVEDPS